MRRVVFSLLLMVLSLPAAGQSEDLRRHFDYDKNAPLDVNEAGAEKRGIKPSSAFRNYFELEWHDGSHGMPSIRKEKHV